MTTVPNPWISLLEQAPSAGWPVAGGGGVPLVLKRSAVRLAGARSLGAASAPSGPASGASQADQPTPVPVPARILQQSAAGAVVEVLCPCGQRIVLDCTFSDCTRDAGILPARPAAGPAAESGREGETPAVQTSPQASESQENPA